MPPLVDFDNIEERNFDPVPDAIYDAAFTGWELVPPKEAGKFPYYNCEYTLRGGDFNNRKVWKILSLSPGALWDFKGDMLVLGCAPEDVGPGSQVDTDDIIASVVGAECRLALKQKTYPKKDGTTGVRSEITSVLTPLPF